MRRRELHFDLPAHLIAQHPAEPRDAARLMVVHRAEQRIEHRIFRDLPELLRPRDALIVNDTRVIPARFFARKSTGGRIEGLFLRETETGWRVLLKPAARVAVGAPLALDGTDVVLHVLERGERGEWLVRPAPPDPAEVVLARAGRTPLPPYIARRGVDAQTTARDAADYQTVFAQRAGAVAAPTAGLHFTPELLARIDAAGVRRAAVTLHVGLGTFNPLTVDELAEHDMHREWFELSAAARDVVDRARREGGRVIAVGTTSARVLETAASCGDRDAPPAGRRSSDIRVGVDGSTQGWTNLFVFPPYSFRLVDALVTNFHLPESTLLALVMAFTGVDLTREAYAAAIRHEYRFYSYGDAMLIV